MNMDMKMRPVIREVTGAVNTDGDTTKAAEVKAAAARWELTQEEIKYLCRRFGILTEDLQ